MDYNKSGIAAEATTPLGGLQSFKRWHAFELVLCRVQRAWSGYHFSLADRAVVVPAVGEVGAVVVEGARCRRSRGRAGSFTNLSCSIATSTDADLGREIRGPR